MGAGSTPQMVRDGARVEVAADDAGLTRGGGLGAADDAVAALLQQLREAAVPVVGGGALGIGGLLPAASSPGRRTTYRSNRLGRGTECCHHGTRPHRFDGPGVAVPVALRRRAGGEEHQPGGAVDGLLSGLDVVEVLGVDVAHDRLALAGDERGAADGCGLLDLPVGTRAVAALRGGGRGPVRPGCAPGQRRWVTANGWLAVRSGSAGRGPWPAVTMNEVFAQPA
jgi:hypothetical protein